MTDKNTLDLAREWAADIDADRETLSQDTIDAAADLISSLPDEWVSADALRKYIADWREGLATAPRGNYEEEMLYDLEDMLPTPPAPRTMAEVEWSDEEHHLAEATAAWAEGTASEVVMLHRNGDTIAVHQSAPHYTGLRELNPAILTPTGRKYRMEPEDDVASATGGVLTTQDVVDECRDVRKERATPEQQDLARDIFGSFPPEERHAHWAKPIPESAAPRPEDVPVGEPWLVEVEGEEAIGCRNDPEDGLCWVAVCLGGGGRLYWLHDRDVTLISRLVPETTEQDDEPEFDPAYLYRDRDGDEWEHLDGRWITGDTHAKRVAEREVRPGRAIPPAEYGPYTRIEDTK